MKAIDLSKILKGHEGETFYSPILGKVILSRVRDTSKNPITISAFDDVVSLNKYGRFGEGLVGECLLFPSEDQRDWDKWVEMQSCKEPKTWSILMRIPLFMGVDYCADTSYNDGFTRGNTPIEKSALALLKIHKLIEVGYGGNISKEVWENINLIKYCICVNANGNFHIRTTREPILFSHTAFHTEKQAKEFLSYSENIQLLKDYFML